MLYDGWDLAYHPNSPAAVHLLTLLECHPPEIQALVGLPADSFHPLPAFTEQVRIPLRDEPKSRLVWEQRILPRVCHEQKADVIHTFSWPALFAQCSSVRSQVLPIPASVPAYARPRRPDFSNRLRESLGAGGLRRLWMNFWPHDLAAVLPADAPGRSLRLLPAVVHPVFSAHSPKGEDSPISALRLPETFIFSHHTGDHRELHALLSSWSWAAAAIGADTPLVAAGLDSKGKLDFEVTARQLGEQESVIGLGPLTIEQLAALYRLCSAVFHPGAISPWSNSLRNALACAKPFVGLDSPWSDSLAGPAAYLVSQTGSAEQVSRALGAALISIIVEPSIAEALIQKAQKRGPNHNQKSFTYALGEAYGEILENSK